jgi:RNA polymerase sigma-70 factor (ECF subfamily)
VDPVTATGRSAPDMRAAHARGREAFAELVVDDETFARHVTRVLGADVSPATLAAIAIEDLYLACACASGVPGAAGAFDSRHRATIRAAIARIVRGADAPEIEQRLVDDLLVGSVTSPPKIAAYAGRAPLERWLGVVAQRAALEWLRENRAEARARDAAAAEPAPEGNTHPELAYLKERYRADFEQALRQALERVAER